MTLNTQDMIRIAMFTSLMAVGALIRIETPFVPITLQFAFMAYAGIILGAKKGMLVQTIYVVIGLMGFPVFTRGGGPYYVMEPTFGYLIGFIIAAFVIGKQSESMPFFNTKRTVMRLVFAVTTGLIIVYTTGMLYLQFIMQTVMEIPMDLHAAFIAGVLPFIAADVIMGAVVVASAAKLLPILKTHRLIARY